MSTENSTPMVCEHHHPTYSDDQIHHAVRVVGEWILRQGPSDHQFKTLQIAAELGLSVDLLLLAGKLLTEAECESRPGTAHMSRARSGQMCDAGRDSKDGGCKRPAVIYLDVVHHDGEETERSYCAAHGRDLVVNDLRLMPNEQFSEALATFRREKEAAKA